MDESAPSSMKEILGLAREPVALRWYTKVPKDLPRLESRLRFCEKLEQAAQGQCFFSTPDEEECMGGAKYCGLCAGKEFTPSRLSGEFLVTRGIYRNVPAVQRAWQAYQRIEPGIFQALAFAPLSRAPFEPDVIFVVCSALQGMELLHANAYDSGERGIGGDAGPICSSMAAVPYLTGKVTYGFGDVGSRGRMTVGDGDVMVSIPGSALARIIANLNEMRAKKAFAE
jgi:uncharacterized protein (DUF169 family)